MMPFEHAQRIEQAYAEANALRDRLEALPFRLSGPPPAGTPHQTVGDVGPSAPCGPVACSRGQARPSGWSRQATSGRCSSTYRVPFGDRRTVRLVSSYSSSLSLWALRSTSRRYELHMPVPSSCQTDAGTHDMLRHGLPLISPHSRTKRGQTARPGWDLWYSPPGLVSREMLRE